MTEQTTPAPELDVEAIRAVLEPPVICSQGGFRINDYHLSKLELALRSAREEIERLKEYLRTCDSTLQLCSERIASDRVAFEALIKALPNITPAIERARKDQNGIDRYVFKAIDDARKLARSP